MGERLSNKIALVTGAGSAIGIGFATAALFHEEGATVILADIDEVAVRARAGELGSPRAVHHALNVTSEESWGACRARLDQEFGGLDILVNNAGVLKLAPVEQIEVGDWQRVQDVNLKGTFLGTKHLAASIRRRGGGSIVNISSVGGLIATPGCGAYAASKSGVRMFTKCTALDLAPDRIRANSVHPGFIDTEMQTDVKRDLDAAAYEKLLETIPLRRAALPREVAYLNLFLASDEASYITGSEFVVDGGMSAI